MDKPHISYEQWLGHYEDFKVKYSFYTKEQGGRESLPLQGIHSDFWYEHSNHTINGIFMIWPEFEDEKYILASMELAGLHSEGNMEDEEWEAWKAKIKTIAIKTLGFKVGEIEEGEVGHNIECL